MLVLKGTSFGNRLSSRSVIGQSHTAPAPPYTHVSAARAVPHSRRLAHTQTVNDLSVLGLTLSHVSSVLLLRFSSARRYCVCFVTYAVHLTRRSWKRLVSRRSLPPLRSGFFFFLCLFLTGCLLLLWHFLIAVHKNKYNIINITNESLYTVYRLFIGFEYSRYFNCYIARAHTHTHTLSLSLSLSYTMSGTEGTSADTEPGNITCNSSSGSTHLAPTETSIASGDGGPPPPKTKRTSAVWDSFTVCENDPSKAMCKLCKSKISRGRDPKHYNTTSLHNHLLYVHHMRKPAVSATSSSTSPGSIPSQDTGVQLGAAKGSPSSSSSPILTAFAAKQPFSANHPQSKKVTEMIGKMICTDLEPFSVVERRGFKSLVAFLEPKYKIPSRHHFSRTVVPELYEAMRGELVQSLKAADGGVINLTTDLWTSNHNAHAYLCITGHWCERVGESSVQRKAGPPLPLHRNRHFLFLYFWPQKTQKPYYINFLWLNCIISYRSKSGHTFLVSYRQPCIVIHILSFLKPIITPLLTTGYNFFWIRSHGVH